MTLPTRSFPFLVATALGILPSLAAAQDPATPKPAGEKVRAVPMVPMQAKPAAAAVRSDGPLSIGATAPDFVSVDREGNEVRLSDFAGKIVVLDFWATWCGPCKAAMPHVQEVAAAHGDRVVTLAVCTSDSRERFEAWVDENGSQYPDVVFTCDPHERTSDERASAKHYRVSGLPTKFVVGADGKVALTMVGYDEHDARLEAGLARLGVEIDAATVARGERQIREAAEEMARAAARRTPPFFPMFGSIEAGTKIPDATLRTADGGDLSLASLRGKPSVIVFAWADVMPAAQLEELAKTYGPYGVQVVAAFVDTPADAFAAWLEKHGPTTGYRAGFDPAGKFPGDPEDFEQRIEWMRGTLLAKFWHGNMRPAMPAMIAVDRDGALLGSFRHKTVRDALGNLLPRAGIELRAEHAAQTVADEAAFQAPAPRAPEKPVERLTIGSPAPDFAMQDHAGKTVRLSDLRGKVVVLDFWATWCGPCKAAMPHAQELVEHYGDQGVVVLASCTNDDREKFEQWVSSNGGDYPDVLFAHDPAGRSAERASRKLFGVSGIPHQYVIDRDGKVVAEVIGYRQGEVLLDAALAKAGIDVPADVLEKAAADQAARTQNAAGKEGARMVPAMPLRRGR